MKNPIASITSVRINGHKLFGVGFLLLIVTDLVVAATGRGEPGDPWSVGFGVAATLFMLVAVLYAARRRTVKLGLGRTRTWLQFHLYGGFLFMVLTLMHSGWRIPAGALTQWILGLSLWVSASGIIGVLIQKWIPRMITSGLSIEAHYHRIPELVGEIRRKAEALLATSDDLIRDFYQLNLATALATPRPRFIYYMDITGGAQARSREFEHLAKVLPAAEREKLDQLQSLYRTKLELDAHYTLQRTLRWWLYGHAPLSFLLVILVAIHIYSVVRY